MFIFAFSSGLFSQQFPVLDNYLINPVSLSPAFIGKSNKFQTYLTYRTAWTGINGHPQVGYLSADGNLAKNMGVGGSLMLSKSGIYKNFTINLNYAYHLRLQKDHVLSFGINLALYQNSLDISDAVLADPLDPVLTAWDKTSETYVNMGFSMLYNWKNLNFCFAFPLLFNNRSLYTTDTNNLLGLDRNWLVYTNYTFDFEKNWGMKLDLLYRATQFSPWTLDFSVTVQYNDSYWLGVFYRKNNIFGITAGLAIINSIVINYNYEFSGFVMNGQSGGSHEVTLGYRLPFPVKTAPKLKDYNR